MHLWSTQMPNRKPWMTPLVVVAVSVLSAAAAYGFVVSCEEELAEAYPAELKADLSACDASDLEIAAEHGIQVDQFAQMLNGSWRLRSRTQQGLTLNLEHREADLYFDLRPMSEQRIAGAALLVDRPKGSSVPASGDSLAARWQIRGDVQDGDKIVVSLAGSSIGSYAHVTLQPEDHMRFVRHKGAYVSAETDGSAWDRVVLMQDNLTYVSCSRGVVERYTRLTDGKPQIEGASIDEYWQRLKAVDSSDIAARINRESTAIAAARSGS